MSVTAHATTRLLGPRGLAAELSGLIASAHDAWDRAPGRLTAVPAGLSLEARGAGDAVLAPMRGALPPTVGAPGGDPDLRVLVIDEGDGLGVDHPLWTLPHFPERQIEAALRDTGLRLHFFDDLGFWQVYDRAARFGLQVLGSGGAVPPWDGGSPLRNFVHWRLLDVGAGLVHAGTVGAAGRGLLLAGPGGAGKSGTVLAALRNGLQSVGDDYVSVDDADPPEARLVYCVLKQDPAGCRRLGLAPTRNSLNWQGKHLLPLAGTARAPQPDGLAITAICLPRLTHGPRTRARPATAKEAFLALAPSGVMQLPAARPEMFARCAALTRRLPAWHLDLGTDPEEVSAVLADLLREVAP